jgi:primosomal protein N' (replication factor Y)
LLLSSAVPSVSSYYQYFTAKYFLLEHTLNHPKTVHLVNMREETGDLMLSRTMKDVLKRTLENRKVSLLLLNNLSYNTALLCGDCGSPITCPNCKVNIQYHKEKDIYRCPYCNKSFTTVKCDNCGSHHLEKYGFGLEKLKESLLSMFSDARIVQVDSESMSDFTSYQKFFSMLDNQEIDIIIGTNIIADIVHPDIAAIGMISADSILHFADYRSGEICYRLISKLTQYPHTETVVQGYNLDHYAITAAICGNFADFYNQEIEVRSRYHYPPFSEMNRLLISGEYKSIYYYANYFKKVFLRIAEGECLGPTYQARYKGVQLLLKHQNFGKVSTLIDEVNKKFKDENVTVSFERYPKL